MKFLRALFGSHPYPPGSRVLVLGHGLGTVERYTTDERGSRAIAIDLDAGRSIEIAIDASTAILRPPLTPAEAESFRNRMLSGEPIGELDLGLFGLRIELSDTDLNQLVEATRKCLALGPFAKGEGAALRVQAQHTLVPIADALGVNPDTLAAEVAAAHGTTDIPPRAPEPPWNFECGPDLQIGTERIAVHPGRWTVRWDGEMLILAHASADPDRMLDEATPLCEPTTHGELVLGGRAFPVDRTPEVLAATKNEDIVLLLVFAG